MLITIIVLVGLAAYFIVAGALFVQAEKPRFLMELGVHLFHLKLCERSLW